MPSDKKARLDRPDGGARNWIAILTRLRPAQSGLSVNAATAENDKCADDEAAPPQLICPTLHL